MIRVLVAHNEPLFRGALAALLRTERDIDVVGETTPAGVLEPDSLQARPDVVVMEPGGTDPLGEVAALCSALPEAKALLVVEASRHDTFARAARQNLRRVGFVTKLASPRHLLSALRSLATGGYVVDPELVVSMMAVAECPLTEREREVLGLAAAGIAVEEIAAKLFLSPRTVRNALGRVKAKTGASNQIQAVINARQSGWL